MRPRPSLWLLIALLTAASLYSTCSAVHWRARASELVEMGDATADDAIFCAESLRRCVRDLDLANRARCAQHAVDL